MKSTRVCKSCGAGIPESAPEGLCTRCVIGNVLSEPVIQANDVRPTIKLDHPAAEDEAEGQTLGHYKLLQKIGEGGCGVVYMAEQERPIRRRVALKVIKLGMDTKQVVARFEAERQALAVMDHPNIAKVFDAGATDTGRPYFVMELVRGVPITRFCDERQLSLRERLDLFIQVCRAIQHAHQKGLIHRDIKPSNILVTMNDGVPVPKVIDFGIAKATAGRLTEQTLFTRFEQFLGTPAYMSPEQAEVGGVDIDTRSDIYSLGVVLYELLTGRTPFDGEALLKRGIEELILTLRDVEPPRPSTRVTSLAAADLETVARSQRCEAPKLVSSLRGDLDWIVMKCLEKDRTRRYETANGLARDVERHLAGETVVAAPPSAAYRMRKFVRRNRVWVMAGSMVAGVLVLGMVGTTGGMLWALRETGKATRAVQSEAQAKRLAEDNARAARLAADNAERAAYRAQLVGAAQAVEEQRMDAAGALLAATPPGLRGWEYRHLSSRLDRSLPSPLPADWRVNGLSSSTDAAVIAVLRLGKNGGTNEWVVLDRDLRKERLVLPGTDPDAFALSPDGSRAVWAPPNADDRRSVTLWSVDTGDILATMPTPRSIYPLNVTWSPSGDRFVVSGTSEFEVGDGHTGAVQGRAEIPGWAYFTGDGRWILARGLAGSREFDYHECRLFDSRSLESQPAVLKLESPAPPWGFAFWKSQVAVGMGDGTLRLLEIVDGVLHERSKLTGPGGILYCAAWSQDGRLVATGNDHGRIRVWEAASGTLRGDFAGPDAVSRGLLFLPESGDFLTVDQKGQHRVWPINSGSTGLLAAHRSFVYPAVFSKDGSMLLTGGWDGAAGYAGGLKLWDARTGTPVAETGQPGDIFWSADLTPDGRCAVVGVYADSEANRRSEVIDLATGAVRTTFRPAAAAKSQPERTLVYPDGRRVLSTYQSGEACLWDLSTGKVLWETDLRLRPERRSTPHGAAAISPDGRLFAFADGDLGIRLVNAETYQDVRRWEAHTEAIRSLSFSPAGKWLLSPSRDHTVGVWEVATGKLVARLVGHGAEVLCAAMSPDGTRIASGGRDGYVRLWDTTHFENVAQLGGHTSYIYSLAWSPDGTQLVSSSGDGTVRLWDTRPLAEQVAASRARAAAVSRIQPLVARALAEARNPQAALEALMKTGGLAPRERELAWQVAVGLAFPRAAAKRD
jgi:WD40 repeat protein/serine/threonine protein kinase